MKSGQTQSSQRRRSAVGSEKGTEFPISEHKIRSKAGVKPIKTAYVCYFRRQQYPTCINKNNRHFAPKGSMYVEL